MDRSNAPYRAGLSYLGDVTRDSAHPPRVAQFRIEMRAAAARLATLMPQRLAPHAQALTAAPVRVSLRLWEIALLSLVIQWGMLPVLAQDFHRVSLAGPLSNIPAVLLTGLIVPLGFLMLAATFVWARLAAALARVLGILSTWLLATVGWFSRLPRVSYRIPESPLWLLLLFFAAFVVLAFSARAAASNRKHRRTRRQLPAPIALAEWISGGALAALTILVASHPFSPSLERGKLEVSVLDVGQGDSIFTAFPAGRTMLIDGGGLDGSERIAGYRSGTDVGEEVVSPYLWSRGLKHLDVVALTHAHHDHLDGLLSVLDNFQVGQLWIGRDEETPAFRHLLEEARARGVAIVHRTAGSDFTWDGVGGEVLWPPDTGPMPAASNDDSLVLRLSDGGVRFLLPGDAQQKAEDNMVARGAPLDATFLKVPHHGSKTSSTESFLSAVRPQAAVVSVGEGNAYGQPAENILARYAAAGVRLFRTDRDGAVTAVTDGSNLTVRPFVEQQHP
jgi:competence protein ComEC